jgi:hypothetical protein
MRFLQLSVKSPCSRSLAFPLPPTAFGVGVASDEEYASVSRSPLAVSR